MNNYIIFLILISILIFLLISKSEYFISKYWQEHDKEFLENIQDTYFNKQILNYNLDQENEFITNILLKSPKNSVFLDVGAHNGSTCIPISKKLKNKKRNDIRIIAFEPNKELSNEINKKSIQQKQY